MAKSFFHPPRCFWQEALPKKHFGRAPFGTTRVPLTLLNGHTFQAKLTSLEGMGGFGTTPWKFSPLNQAPRWLAAGQPHGQGVGWDQCLSNPRPEQQWQFKRKRYSVSACHLNSYQVSGVTHPWFHRHLGPPGHAPS